MVEQDGFDGGDAKGEDGLVRGLLRVRHFTGQLLNENLKCPVVGKEGGQRNLAVGKHGYGRCWLCFENCENGVRHDVVVVPVVVPRLRIRCHDGSERLRL